MDDKLWKRSGGGSPASEKSIRDHPITCEEEGGRILTVTTLYKGKCYYIPRHHTCCRCANNNNKTPNM